MVEFLRCKLTAKALCLGERIKGSIYRPSSKTIRYSMVTPALRGYFGSEEIYAAGYLIDNPRYNKTQFLIYSPRDRVQGISKIPITIEFLTDVWGEVFVLKNEAVAHIQPAPNESFSIFLGGLRWKGFGECELKFEESKTYEIDEGILNTRIPLNTLSLFKVDQIVPVFGYLSEEIEEKYYWTPALFEGSRVKAPRCFLKEGG